MNPNPHDWSNGASAVAYSEVISGSDERSSATSKFPGGSSGSVNATFCLGHDSKRNCVLVPDESCPVPGQFHGCNQSEARYFLNESILINSLELELALSGPEKFIRFRRFCYHRGYSSESIRRLFDEERKRPFMVTTAERGYTMTDLPDDVITRCFSEAEQEEIKASGLRVPSIWDLHQQGHLLKPIHEHVLDHYEAEEWVCDSPELFCKLKLDDYNSKQRYEARRSLLDGIGYISSNGTMFKKWDKDFLVSTSDRSYMLTDLSARVVSRCFSEADQVQIAAFGLLVPSIRDFNQGPQRHLLIPLRNDIFKELEAEAAAHPHAASVHMPAEFPDGCVNRNNAVQKFLPASSDESQVRTSPGQLYLLHPGELEVACSHPHMITEYLSIRDKKCSKSSCGEPICRCEICEIKRKHEVLLGKSKVQEQYDKGARFLVTTDKRDYNVSNLSARIISSYFPEADQGQIAAQGLHVPSIWDLPQKAHLLKPLHKDILKELKAEAAVHPQAAFVHVPPQLHDDFSKRDNAGSPKLLAASSDQLNFSNEVMINITPSEHASSNPDSRNGASFQLESIEAEPPCNATFLERARGFFQPGNEETEPLFNRGRMTETTLVAASQVSLTLLTHGSTSGSPLSPNAKILKQFATICNAVGFLCCFCGILVCGRKPGRAARITTGCGYIVTAFGFLAMMGMTLNDELMLWFTGVTCIALLPVLAFAFKK